jgi:hypothetical protein
MTRLSPTGAILNRRARLPYRQRRRPPRTALIGSPTVPREPEPTQDVTTRTELRPVIVR